MFGHFQKFAVRRTTWGWVFAVVVIHVAMTTFLNLVVFKQEWLSPVSDATSGLLSSTLLANLFMTVVMSIVLLGFAALRPTDLAFERSKLLIGCCWLLAALLFVNFAELIGCWSMGKTPTLNSVWRSQPLVEIGQFLGQVFGNAFYEETIFRGFLVMQLTMLIKRWRPGWTWVRSLLAGLLISQTVFALVHLPNRIYTGSTGSSWALVLNLSGVGVIGILLASLWLVTNNLFVAIAVHAVFNYPLMIFEPVLGIGGVLSILMLPLWLLLTKLFPGLRLATLGSSEHDGE